MGKIFLLFVFLALVLSFPPQVLACVIDSPGSLFPGQTLTLSVRNFQTAYRVPVVIATHDGSSVSGFNVQPIPPDRLTIALPSVQSGRYNVTVQGVEGGVVKDECLYFGIQVASAPTGGTGTGIQKPSGWLPFAWPGFGPSPASGINFIKENLVPFLVSLTLFLVITLSLIFTIIGGIMWIMSGGDKEALTKAKNTVTYALIGLVLGLGSFIILAILGNFFGVNLLGTSWWAVDKFERCRQLGIPLGKC